ncbi:MAG: hypothetical protein CBD34_00265 [Rickettsiales bacterium TMED174]|nr:MAG: hypothetical protein CBD34_00265 [Rickettsiales bacterium TMED174]
MKIFRNNSQTKQSDLLIYENRIKNKNLKWVKQIIKILKKNILTKKRISLNDLGCNLFQLYKGLKNNRLAKNFLYTGYDHDKTYIKIGLKHFPELKKKYKIMNLEKTQPSSADVSIISATLEHLNNPNKCIENILNSTKQLIIIRSFFGKKKIKKLFKNKKYVDRPYFINQFKVSWIKKKLEDFNFKNIEIIKDNATKGKVRSIYPGLKRKFSIVVAKKV